METEEKYSIKVIVKTMELLKCFSPRQPEWSANELSNKLNMNRTTVYRILTTLTKGGFVQSNPKSGGFRLGFTLIGLSLALFDSMDIRTIAGPVLKGLTQKTGESVHLTIWDKDKVMVIDHWESPSDFKVLVPLGKKLFAYCTATGKLFLSELSEEDLERYLSEHELKTLTPNTIVDKEALREEVRKVRQKQIAFDFEEYAMDIVTCAAPVYSYDQKINAAIAVVGPSRRMQTKIEEIEAMTREASELISSSLGYVKPSSFSKN